MTLSKVERDTLGHEDDEDKDTTKLHGDGTQLSNRRSFGTRLTLSHWQPHFLRDHISPCWQEASAVWATQPKDTLLSWHPLLPEQYSPRPPPQDGVITAASASHAFPPSLAPALCRLSLCSLE